MTLIQSRPFRYGASTKFSLKIFDNVPVLEAILSFYGQAVFPNTSLDESSIEFEF